MSKPPITIERRRGFTPSFEIRVHMRMQKTIYVGGPSAVVVLASLRKKARCAKCDAPTPERSLFVLDHIIPRSKGGPHTPQNVEPLCKKCNAVKTAADATSLARAKRLSGETGRAPKQQIRNTSSWPAKGGRKLQSKPFDKRRD